MIIGIVLLVVLVLVLSGRRRRSAPHTSAPASRSLDAVLQRAVLAGRIDEDQARLILEDERIAAGATPARPAAVPPALEAFGYLGAVLVVVGAVSLISRSWDDFETWIRLVILGTTTVALTAAGLAIRDEQEPVLWRLRGVVLLLASGALAGFAVVLSMDGFDATNERVGVFVGAVVAAHGGVLWWRRDRPAQELACLAGLITAVAAATIWLGGGAGWVGLVLWALGVAWFVATRRGVLPPPYVGLVLGALLALVSAGVTISAWHHGGALFALATAGAFVGVGIVFEEFEVTITGVVGTFVYLPIMVGIFFGSTAGVPGVLLVSGLALLALMVQLVRRRERLR